MGISGSVKGADLLKALDKFPKKFQKNVFERSIRAGAVPIRDEARILVPEDTGNLRKSIDITKRRQLRINPSLVTYSVSPVKKNIYFSTEPVNEAQKKGKEYWKQYNAAKTLGEIGGFYARFIEFGTENMKADPFLRPAFDRKADKGITETKDYIKRRLKKTVQESK